MKRLRTVNGVKHIQFFNRRDFEDKVQEAITQHRATLIERLLGGLNDYMEYRFHRRIDQETAGNIREKLMTLKQQAVPIDECQTVVDELLQKDVCVLSSGPYYESIDERIRFGLK